MPNHNTGPTGRKACRFPSTKLLAYCAELAAEADRIAQSSQLAECRTRAFADAILSIGRLRLDHEDIAPCQCWYDAVKTAKAAA